jgi:hypothetical protein
MLMGTKAMGWNAKPRTMLRFIKPGDVFMLALGDGRYGLGRILSQVSLGHVAEILDAELAEPSLNAVSVDTLRRRGRPIVVDSYGLFDKKIEGDWRIVSHQDGFVPSNVDDVFFTYGSGPLRKKVDVFGQVKEIPAAEAAGLPLYTPKGDEQVKQEFFAAH